MSSRFCMVFKNFLRGGDSIRLPIWTNPLRDPQQQPPAGRCPWCQGELYGEEQGLCSQCREIINQQTNRQEDDKYLS